MQRNDILKLLFETPYEALRERADEVRAREKGEHVFVRGLIEFSNRCERNCRYCGLRSANPSLKRYRLDEAQIVEAAERAGVKLCACHQNRFNKSIQKIRTAVEEGRFGRMLHGTAHIRWNRERAYYEQAPWRGTWAQDGGALMNQCIHNIDLLRWMMGDDVTEVMAYTDNLEHDYIEAEDLGMALIRFGNGAYGIVEGTTNVYPHNLEETLYLFGQDGTVKAGGKSVNIIDEWDFRDGRGDPATIKMEFAENPPNVYGYGHTPLYADVIDAIRHNRTPYVDGRAGMRALELVLAIYQSAAEGRPVRLPLGDCATTDFAGRFGR